MSIPGYLTQANLPRINCSFKSRLNYPGYCSFKSGGAIAKLVKDSNALGNLDEDQIADLIQTLTIEGEDWSKGVVEIY